MRKDNEEETNHRYCPDSDEENQSKQPKSALSTLRIPLPWETNSNIEIEEQYSDDIQLSFEANAQLSSSKPGTSQNGNSDAHLVTQTVRQKTSCDHDRVLQSINTNITEIKLILKDIQNQLSNSNSDDREVKLMSWATNYL